MPANAGKRDEDGEAEMYTLPVLILKALQILLINLALSGDNVGVIALAIKNMPSKRAKQANLLGTFAALLLRIVFVASVGFLFTLKWLHIDIIGGLVLVYITFTLIHDEKKLEQGEKKLNGGFLKAVITIVIADVSMSLDNVLAIVAIAAQDGGSMNMQEIGLVIFGLAACVPIIFFFSGMVAKLMKRLPVIIYVCAGLLIYTAVRMIYEDSLIAPLAAHSFDKSGVICALVLGGGVVVYGIVYSQRAKKKAADNTAKKEIFTERTKLKR
jgi:YjbE family integral membrane protein